MKCEHCNVELVNGERGNWNFYKDLCDPCALKEEYKSADPYEGDDLE